MKKINDYFEVSEDAEYEIVDENLIRVYKGRGLAIKEGAEAEAMERGAIAEAWKKGAIAYALKKGSIAYALVKGAIAVECVEGAFAENCFTDATVIKWTEFEENNPRVC